ncbi:hypothetical protein KP509_07G021400 [Ceratopteris richardii]|uniref:Uncharacterized protein n=1 Tax=Ceratopteris richardii TaxID=49495 RepID=A0A8T2U984_CERRI|nr:hypothetical protein KP509_07G021400 [Ceratopteris richardii]KAH7432412.1 hypothetical protein KP509_07G021400 [Ceratopteris richardii]KAH7432413.1 hypothetical protein KP509_07G021400 [Ceratopteris richardii]KAH7432414.1 hypothetical protein KP509_07G021400 [Ceratopteris richardii]KAH7432415.1 hypothetical protein KP509_07G021400 [Ceratopteris richardii]
MDYAGSHTANGVASDTLHNSFASVLQEIYQQAQTEIDARNQSVVPQFGSLSRSGEYFVSSSVGTTHGSTPSFGSIQYRSPLNNISIHSRELPLCSDSDRFEPLVDPALSFISSILAEEDVDPYASTPFLSPEEFIAHYQAKATEVAALLKEDSPSLPLRIGQNSASPESTLTSGSEDSCSETFGANFQSTCMDIESQFLFSDVPEASRNELLLTGLRGPIGKPVLGISDSLAFETNPGQSLRSVELPKPIKPGSQDDIGVKPHSQKRATADKTGKGLKPRKERPVTRKKNTGKARSGKDGEQELLNMNDLLVQCVQAIGVNDNKRAMEILNKVRQCSLPYGNGVERLAYYFAEALDARFSGTGWPLYLGLFRRPPSSAEILRATQRYMQCCPFVTAYHYFINQTILNAAERASKVHILELQLSGFQYPSLLKALSERPGGPPEVHVIALNFPHYSMLPARTDVVLEAVQKTGRQLREYAASYGVPFQFTAWAGIREEVNMQDFVSPYRSADEVLVILSTSLLRYIMDENLDSSVLRSKLLKQGRDLNPEVYVQGIVTGSYSTPYFPRRFKEALLHFESVFDMLDTFIDRQETERLIFESQILGKAIMHIVACEGTEVVERIDKYKHWQAVTEEVGFKQLPLDEKIKNNVHTMLKSWHKEYIVGEDGQYLLMGWKGRMLHAMSTWKASPEEI